MPDFTVNFNAESSVEFGALFDVMLHKESFERLQSSATELTHLNYAGDAIEAFITRGSYGFHNALKVLVELLIPQFSMLRCRSYSTEKLMVWSLNNHRVLVIFKKPSPSDIYTGLVIDTAGANGFSSVLDHLQQDQSKPIEERVSIRNTTDEHWYLSTEYKQYISFCGDTILVNKLKELPFKELDYLLSGDSRLYQEQRTAVKYWVDKQTPNAVKDFFKETLIKFQNINNQFNIQ